MLRFLSFVEVACDTLHARLLHAKWTATVTMTALQTSICICGKLPQMRHYIVAHIATAVNSQQTNGLLLFGYIDE